MFENEEDATNNVDINSRDQVFVSECGSNEKNPFKL